MFVKKFLIPFAILATVLLLIAFWWVSFTKPVGSSEEEQRFVITRGSSAVKIGNNLYEEGLVRSSLAFRFYVQLTGRSKKIQAGAYDLSPNLSLYELVDELTSGPRQVWVTIPEGLRREEIADRFVVGLEKKGEEATEFRNRFMVLTSGEEGYLFPDTYLFERTATADLVVSTVRNTFETRISTLQEEIESSDLSLTEIVILASIIERETLTGDERPIVAGILKNRLDIGMGLQADATVQYAAASQRCGVGAVECDWWRPPTGTELSINSSYNTYRFAGLPPGPIASPGIASLSAAASPSTTDYLYYIHDASGQIHYAETFEEHNSNVARYLR